jgi:chromate transporter
VSEAGRPSARETFLVFLKLGVLGFGGPLAHVALMEDEVVKRRGWFERRTFLDLMAAINLVPGPNSTEMALGLGYLRCGWRGLVAAGAGFIGPAFLTTLVLAWAADAYGARPAARAFLDGLKPAILAIIIGAVVRLGREALPRPGLVLVAVAAGAAAAAGAHELLVLAAAALLGLLARPPRLTAMLAPLPLFLAPPLPDLVRAPDRLPTLALSFLKIGATLFGSGYLLVTYLDAELVDRLGWLTKGEVLDAVAAGQVTPGPVLSAATWVGYRVGGVAGAVIATAAIFAPSFVVMLLLVPRVERLSRSERWRAVLDVLNAAVVGLLVLTAARLAREAAPGSFSTGVAAAATLLHVIARVPALWIVAIGIALGAGKATGWIPA